MPITFWAKVLGETFWAKVLGETFWVKRFGRNVLGETFFFWNHILHLGLGLVFWDILHSHPLWMQRKCGQALAASFLSYDTRFQVLRSSDSQAWVQWLWIETEATWPPPS